MTTSEYPLLYVLANFLPLQLHHCEASAKEIAKKDEAFLPAIVQLVKLRRAYLCSRLKCRAAQGVDWCSSLLSLADPGSAATTWATSCVTDCECSLQLPHNANDRLQDCSCFLLRALVAQPPSRHHITSRRPAGLGPTISYLADNPYTTDLAVTALIHAVQSPLLCAPPPALAGLASTYAPHYWFSAKYLW